MSAVFGHPVAQALAWALIHFVWQGAAIALMLIAIQRAVPLSASARYVSGVVALAVMLIAPIATFLRLSAIIPAAAPPSPSDPAALQLFDAAARFKLANTAPASTMSDVLPMVILAIWAIGVTVLSLRLLGGWIVARRLARRALSPASAEIQALARRVAGRLALDRVVGVFESSAVTVPVMIGWMKPVVLLPASAISGLSIVQVEALLAHELAHVRRHDYLVNLLQSAVETLLFYHPAVWFVSRRMRIDREHCCDDLAVHVCDRVVYATALSDLAAMTTTPRMALAATDGPLLHRVRRILGQTADRPDPGTGWMSACLVVLLAGSVAPVVMTKEPSEPPVTQVEQAGLPQGQPPVSGGQGGVVNVVVGGVQGGVVAGVVGGVQGGVVDGVVGGVRDQVIAPVQETQTVTQSVEQARAAERQALENQIRELQKQLERLQKESTDTDVQRVEARSKARREDLEASLQELVIDREQVRKLAEQKLISPSQIAELDAKIAATQRQMLAERGDKDLYLQDMDLLKQKIAEKTAKEKLDTELTLQKLKANQIELHGNVTVDAEQAAEIRELLKMKELAVEAPRTLILSDTDTARAGDIAVVEIQNEPDMPRDFIVQPDGTIRFPLVGSIRVQGLTARQIGESLGKQFKDRKLTASSVRVTLRRAGER